VLNKTYQDTQELTRDRAIQDLQIGYLKDKELVFTPEESKHKAFFVEKTEDNGKERHFMFHVWDEQAGKEIESATNMHAIPETQPAGNSHETITDTQTGLTNGNSLEKQILQELIKDNIIKDLTTVSYILTKHSFTVNSVKQSPQVFAKYRTLTESIKREPLSENFSLEYVIN
jgi:hypothetical protein